MLHSIHPAHKTTPALILVALYNCTNHTSDGADNFSDDADDDNDVDYQLSYHNNSFTMTICDNDSNCLTATSQCHDVTK
ncbi:hypothetical protein PoB_001030300 [Plakobranchus ocellatus]|uniref:Uncharacterized protein n=1 Tax=Plakobranchus ocellatus TaxID=259542 RepID=A0AAV3YNE7_9GAST|nr:hypothetical protein PoB_001030300 [Plakobranchus ocellatus]